MVLILTDFDERDEGVSFRLVYRLHVLSTHRKHGTVSSYHTTANLMPSVVELSGKLQHALVSQDDYHISLRTVIAL